MRCSSVGTVWGWGRQLEGGPTSRYLRSAEVKVLENKDCHTVYGNLFSSGSGLLCARIFFICHANNLKGP